VTEKSIEKTSAIVTRAETLDLDKPEVAGAIGPAGFDVVATVVVAHVARLEAEGALGRHDRLHGQPLDLGAAGGIHLGLGSLFVVDDAQLP
jgi:hypothetical protein